MNTVMVVHEIQEKDIEAGLCLLKRILRITGKKMGTKRAKLEALKNRLEHHCSLNDSERRDLISSYLEVVG